MEVDKTASTDASARRTAEKRRESELEEQRLQAELGRARRERQKLAESEREKGERELVEISKAASAQMDAAKKLNSGRVRAVGQNFQEHYEALAGRTSEEIKRLDKESLAAIRDHRASGMEKLRSVTERSEDPFYRLKTLDPVLGESGADYTIQVSLPEHEARNLFVSGEGPYVKLSLARRFQEDLSRPETGRATKTSSYQSVTEQVAMPGAFDAKKISRSYENGVVTIRVPKQGFGPMESV